MQYIREARAKFQTDYLASIILFRYNWCHKFLFGITFLKSHYKLLQIIEKSEKVINTTCTLNRYKPPLRCMKIVDHIWNLVYLHQDHTNEIFPDKFNKKIKFDRWHKPPKALLYFSSGICFWKLRLNEYIWRRNQRNNILSFSQGKFHASSTKQENLRHGRSSRSGGAGTSIAGCCEAFGLDDIPCAENPCSWRFVKLFSFQVFTMFNLLILAMSIQKHECDIHAQDLWTGPCRRTICYYKWFKLGAE